MVSVVKSRAVAVRAAAGTVWTQQGPRDPERLELPPRDFAALLEDCDVYVEGSLHNAELLVRLHAQRSKGVRVWMCRPYRYITPQQAITRMQADRERSRPRRDFVPFGEGDAANFRLLSAYIKRQKLDEVVYSYLQDHPAYLVRRFLPFGDDRAFVLLLCDVTDPRWFRNANRPGRHNKLLRYLGLSQKMNARGLTAMRAWHDASRIEEAKDPQFYFYNLWITETARNRVRPAENLRRVTRRFVTFLSLVWLDNLNQSRGWSAMFDPNLFFQSPSPRKRFEVLTGF